MKKKISEEAYFERLNELAQSKKPLQKESNHSLGTLIDYKRAENGVAYGIIKENHHYYIKKAGLKENPNASDFAYIGGLQNIKEYQYQTLAEAEKQRNFLFQTINEAHTLKADNKKSRLVTETTEAELPKPQELEMAEAEMEEGAKEEIGAAEEKLGDLDAATAAAEVPAEPEVSDVPDTTVPIPADGEGEPEAVSDVPADGGDALDVDALDVGGAETPEGGAPEEEVPAEPEGEPEGGGEAEMSDEVKEFIGKAGQKAQSMNLDNDQIEGYIKEFLGYFKNDLATKFDPQERENLADETIIKVEVGKDGAEKELEASPEVGGEEPVTEPELPMEEEDVCAECGGFGKYAESRGYDVNSMMECGDDEMANVVSGYANAHGEGQNDGDFKLVALLVNPEVIDSLKGEYGHEEYAEKLTPYTDELNECSAEEKQVQIQELWGGLKSLGQAAGQGIKTGVQKAGQAVSQAAQNVGQKVGQAGTAIKQQYYSGEVDPQIKKLTSDATALGQRVAKLNNVLTKAGKQPVNINSLLQTIANQLRGGGGVNLSRYGTAAEGLDDMAKVEVQPNMLKEDDELEEPETEEPEVGEPEGEETPVDFAPAADNLGVGVVKADGAEAEVEEVGGESEAKVEINADTVNLTVNEGKKKMNEKWDTDYKTPESEKGKYKGKSLEDLEKMKAALDKKRPEGGYKKGSAEYEKEKEINFAIRAKKGWKGGVDEGMKMKMDMPTDDAEDKLREYVRLRLQEKMGKRQGKKVALTETKISKSKVLLKLDEMIDKQLQLFENANKK